MATPLPKQSRSQPEPTAADVTAVLPIHEEPGAKRETWLKQALASLPDAMPYIVARNTGNIAAACNKAVEEAKKLET